jgi:hypothetical protein
LHTQEVNLRLRIITLGNNLRTIGRTISGRCRAPPPTECHDETGA